MKNKGGLIAFLIVVIAFVTFFLILGISSCNDAAYVESYTADVVIDGHGNITVDEYLVTNYRYLTRDVKTGKNHINNPLLSGVSYSDYQNDTASFDTIGGTNGSS